MKRIYLIAFLFSIKMTYSQSAFVKDEKKDIIEAVASVLEDYYIGEEMSIKLKKKLLKNLKSGAYKNVKTRDAFAKLIEDQCQEISKDKHIQLGFSPTKSDKNETKTNDNKKKRAGKYDPFENFGFQRVRIFEEKKTGRVKIGVFMGKKEARETIDKIFESFADMESIIIDLRDCIGGEGEMVNYVMSYFFEAKPIKYSTVYNRNRDIKKDKFTLGPNKIPANKRLLKQKLYILTSNFTFSGGEAFSYHMKHFKRATIVGETTGGGANMCMPVGLEIEDEDTKSIIGKYEILVPIIKLTNVITGTNWEGVGVKPDVETTADDAWEEAFELAGSK